MANNAHHHDEDEVNKIQQRLRADIMGLLDYSIDNNAPLERFIFIRNLLLVTMTSDAAALYGTSSFKDNPAPQHEKFAAHASESSNEEAEDDTEEAPAPKKASKAKAAKTAKKSAPKPAVADADDGFDSELGAPFDVDDDEGPAPKKEPKPAKSKSPAKKDPEPSFEDDDDEFFGGGDSADDDADDGFGDEAGSSSLGRVADSSDDDDDDDDGFGDDEPAQKKTVKSAGKSSPKEVSPITTEIEDDEFF